MRGGERHGELRQRAADLVGERDQFLHGGVLRGVARQRRVEPARGECRAAGAEVDGLPLPVAAGQEPGGQRAPHQHAHPVAAAHRQHRRLDAAGQDRVRRLLGAEPAERPPFGDVVRLHDLLGREGRAAERADLPGPDQVGEHAECLLDVGGVVRAVHLVEVDPVGAQPAQAVLDLPDDPAPRVAAPVGPLPHREVDLRGEHHVVAPAAQGLADDLLRLAGRVHVGGVHEIDSAVECRVDDPGAVVVVGVADRAEHHGAEAVDADLDAGAAEDAIAHVNSLGCTAPAGWRAVRSR